MSALVAQTRTELVLALRNGEQVLVSLVIPAVVLVFFSVTELFDLPAGFEEPVDFVAPGVLALAVMSSAMVSLGIGTGFERHYGVLKRLGVTPLGRPRWVGAKALTVLAIEIVQLVVLVPLALVLGWTPAAQWWAYPLVLVLGTAAFAGIGLTMAGTLRGTTTLALANALYVVLLLIGGMVIPLDALPVALATIAELLPAAALADITAAVFTDGITASIQSWAVLVAWAVVSPTVAATTFRWQ